MTKYLILAILILFVGYGLVEAWPLIAGPSLSIDSPTNNATSSDGIMVVSGNAARATLLTINGSPVLHEEDGGFSTILTFPRGGSILTFVATDRFGRKVTATRNIFVQ